FFFSSRRRHTRSDRDWSSDVCSSDLHSGEGGIVYAQTRKDVERIAAKLAESGASCDAYHAGLPADRRRQVQDDFVNERMDVVVRSEERRVGKECRARGWRDHEDKRQS